MDNRMGEVSSAGDCLRNKGGEPSNPAVSMDAVGLSNGVNAGIMRVNGVRQNVDGVRMDVLGVLETFFGVKRRSKGVPMSVKAVLEWLDGVKKSVDAGLERQNGVK
jgi:hypothetical protein